MPSENYEEYEPTTWGSNEFDHRVPSGQKIRVRKLDPMILMAEGLLGDLDFLTSIVTNTHIPNGEKTAIQRAKEAKAKVGTAGQPKEEPDPNKIMKDLFSSPEKMKNFTNSLNRVLMTAVVAPKVWPLPEGEEERVKGRVYIDSVDFNDKVSVFTAVTKGVTDLEQFRTGSEEPVGSVAHGADVSKSAKRSPRSPKK